MPTAGRLVASFLWAALAWVTSMQIVPLFPEGTDVGRFAEINAGIAFIVGWTVAGKRAGGTWSAAISYGLTATIAMVFWCLFLHCFAEMSRQSMRRIYDGPMEALVDVFELMFENAQLMAVQPVLMTLLIGGIVAGLMTEAAARTWR